MRVCLITPELAPYQVGGIGAYVLTLAEGLHAAGHSVDVVGCDLHPSWSELRHNWGRSLSVSPGRSIAGHAIACYVADCFRWLGRRVRGVWRLSSCLQYRALIAAALAVGKHMRRHSNGYDIVEFPNWPGYGAFLQRECRAAYVARLSTSVHDTDDEDHWLPVCLERLSVGKAHKVIANSVAMNQKGMTYYGYRESKSVIIPHGVQDARRPNLTPSNEVLQLISLGRAEDRKGTDLLITALSRVLPECPRVAFRFVGPRLKEYLESKPGLKETWSELCRRCPGRVFNKGRVSEDEKIQLLATSHWLLCPSRFESFGLMAAEAMCFGTPVIYGAVGGLNEVGQTGPHNRPVGIKDVVDLEHSIRIIAEKGIEYAESLRKATRVAFESNFSQTEMITRTVKAYETAIAAKRSNYDSKGL